MSGFQGPATSPPGPRVADTELDAVNPRGLVRIDGVIDPAEWAGAPIVDEFNAREPIEGAPASQRTEVRVLYTRTHLYIGYSCYDTDPDGIVRRVGPRDNWGLQTDMAHLDLDPYNDHRNAYHFTVSVANLQTEAYGWATNWDGVWESATSVTDEGWFAEMAIPFAILRFEPGPSQTMGINFARKIQRHKEELQWLGWGRDDWRRVDMYGHLNGLQGLRGSHDLEVLPYVRARGQQFYRGAGEPVGYADQWKSDAGLDLKYALTSNLALDVALNPDFGQVAPDAEQINVTRYERFNRELRPFFQEGQEIFKTPLQIFYSRRIGKQVAGGVEANLLTGAQLTGRTGPYQIGVIEAITERKDYTVLSGGVPVDRVEPMANYSVVRVKRDVLSRSTVGFLAVSKDVRSGGGRQSYQRALGMDLNLSMGRNYYLDAMLARSLNPGGDGDDWAGSIKAGQNSDLWAYSLDYTYLGPDLSVNQVGYITQVDRRRRSWNLGWKPRPERYGIRRVEVTLSGTSAHNFAGQYTEGRVGGGLRLQTMGYLDFNVRANVNDTLWRDVYAPDPFATSYTARLYRSRDWRVSFSTDRTRDYSLNLSGDWGDFLDYGDAYWGKSGQIRGGFAFKPSERLSGSVNMTHIREYFGDGALDETKNLLVLRASFYFTANLSVGIYDQYRLYTSSEETERDIGANTLNLVISHHLNAKSILYIVYNELRDDRIGDGEYYRAYGSLPVSDRVIFTKFTYWFSL